MSLDTHVDIFERIDTSKLYPPFVAKLKQLEAALEKRGIRYYAISALRTVEEQDALYAQGRTKPGKIVTKAKGGQSAHNFGVAADFCMDADMKRDGLQPDWNVDSYKVLAEEATELGLEAGLKWRFVDAPHIQLPLATRGITLEQLSSRYRKGGFAAVFAFLDETIW